MPDSFYFVEFSPTHPAGPAQAGESEVLRRRNKRSCDTASAAGSSAGRPRLVGDKMYDSLHRVRVIGSGCHWQPECRHRQPGCEAAARCQADPVRRPVRRRSESESVSPRSESESPPAAGGAERPGSESGGQSERRPSQPGRVGGVGPGRAGAPGRSAGPGVGPRRAESCVRRVGPAAGRISDQPRRSESARSPGHGRPASAVRPRWRPGSGESHRARRRSRSDTAGRPSPGRADARRPA